MQRIIKGAFALASLIHPRKILLHVNLHKRILIESAKAVFIAVPNLDEGFGFAAKLGVKSFGFSGKAEKAAFSVADGG
jgi:hypothetical protein